MNVHMIGSRSDSRSVRLSVEPSEQRLDVRVALAALDDRPHDDDYQLYEDGYPGPTHLWQVERYGEWIAVHVENADGYVTARITAADAAYLIAKLATAQNDCLDWHNIENSK